MTNDAVQKNNEPEEIESLPVTEGKHVPDPENCERCWQRAFDGSLDDVIEVLHV